MLPTLVIALLLVVDVLGVVSATAQTLPPGFADSVVFGDLNVPTAVRFAADGRVFVAEKSGLIKVFDSLSDPSPDVFADLRTNVHNFLDRGLLGLELHPSFPAVPYVYTLYTLDAPIGGVPPVWNDTCVNPPGATINGCVVGARLSRLTAAGNAMVGPEQVLIEDWCQQFPSHSIGTLAFGSDGALYVGAGDGASFGFVDYGQAGYPQLNPCGDPPTGVGGVQSPPTAEGGALRSQDLRTLGDAVGYDGAILRIDPLTGAALPDNPLYGGNPGDDRIVAFGFRNPFRFTPRPGTSELWIGDVGWGAWEEIDVLPDPTVAAGNFGWPCYEGPGPQSGYAGTGFDICEDLYEAPGAVSEPFFTYRHSENVVPGDACGVGSSAISGLAFYTGGSYPAAYGGALFFADYARSCIWVMFPGAGGAPDPATREVFALGAVPVDLQIGPGGDLFYVDIFGGTLRRVQFTAGNQPPVAVAAASPTNGPVPLEVQFDGAGSSDPENQPLAYAWDLDGDGQFDDSSDVAPQFSYGTPGQVTVGLEVTDPHGLTDTDAIVITPSNTAPTAAIVAPSGSLNWRVGDLIAFQGEGTDPDEGTLAPEAFSWTLVLQHCPSNCHTHVVQTFEGVDHGTLLAPDHEYPSHLELRLTVTDAGGLRGTTSVAIFPDSVALSFETAPTGLSLVVGSGSGTAPFTRTVIVGSQNSVSAPSPQMAGGAPSLFTDWSDGGAQTHVVVAPTAPTTYVATFVSSCEPAPDTCGNGIVESPCEACDLGIANCPPGAPCSAGCSGDCQVIGRCTQSGAFCTSVADCPSLGEGCCGDGTADGPAEQCDDANLLAGDCCSPSCTSEPAGTCEPQTCSARGPHLVAATVKRAITKDVDGDGASERWRTRGTVTLGAGQGVDPDSETVALTFSENGTALYAPALAPGAFVQNKDVCTRRWGFKDRQADVPGAIGWKTGKLKQAKQAGGAAGVCGTAVTYNLTSRKNAPFSNPAGAHLRQTLQIGDDCFTALLACAPTAKGLTCATP